VKLPSNTLLTLITLKRKLLVICNILYTLLTLITLKRKVTSNLQYIICEKHEYVRSNNR